MNFIVNNQKRKLNSAISNINSFSSSLSFPHPPPLPVALYHVSWPLPALFFYSYHSCPAALLQFLIWSIFASSLPTLSPHLFHGILLVLPWDFFPEFVLGFITTCQPTAVLCVTRLLSMQSLHFYIFLHSVLQTPWACVGKNILGRIFLANKW